MSIQTEFFGSSAKSIYDQTGWKRPYPQTILMDTDILQKVTEHDFDIMAPGFEEYAERRGCLNGAGVKGSDRWKIVTDHSWTLKKFLASGLLSRNEKKTIKFDEADVRTTWKCILYAKAHLQDCWELWNQTRRR
ncbi:hypothetical protein FACS1894216_02170 [Synergistales bacterium]|nr:hypothetical protein FACS1894216_02170 [Synergistales bacterium]